MGVRAVVEWWDRYQVALYLAAIAGGSAVGLAAPEAAPALEHLIEPVLALLLFATFLGVPVVQVGRSLRDLRFLLAVFVANFVLVPVVAFGLSRFVADDRGLVLGVLLVLLTPCIDYVIVFTGLAGGARARLLAAAPLLMALQVALLPLYLWVFTDASVLAVIEVGPFVEAFIVLIVVPFAAAAAVQVLASRPGREGRVGRSVEAGMAGAMVPLMMVTLSVVIASQIDAVGSSITDLVRLLPLYAGFVVAGIAVGLAIGRVARLDVAATRAAIRTGRPQSPSLSSVAI